MGTTEETKFFPAVGWMTSMRTTTKRKIKFPATGWMTSRGARNNLSQFTGSSSSVCPSVVASSARCVQRTTGAAGFCRKNQARKLLKLSQPATRPETDTETERERQGETDLRHAERDKE